MKWYGQKDVLPVDCRKEVHTEYYSFTVPPASALFVRGEADLTASANGKSCPRIKEPGGVRILLPEEETGVMTVRIEAQGRPGRFAITEPIRILDVHGTFASGDWARVDGLRNYSGRAVYSQRFMWKRRFRRAVLEIEDVCSAATVYLNGERIGVRCAPPWSFELTDVLAEGKNELKIVVASTLSGFYQTVPTRYVKAVPSGLLGRVVITAGE